MEQMIGAHMHACMDGVRIWFQGNVFNLCKLLMNLMNYVNL